MHDPPSHPATEDFDWKKHLWLSLSSSRKLWRSFITVVAIVSVTIVVLLLFYQGDHRSRYSLGFSLQWCEVPECPETDSSTRIIAAAAARMAVISHSTDLLPRGQTLSAFPTEVDIALDNGFTISFWMRTSSGGMFGGIIDKAFQPEDHDLFRGFKVTFNQDKSLRFQVAKQAGGYAVATNAIEVSDGQWHFVVGVCTLSNIVLFVDSIAGDVTDVDTGFGRITTTVPLLVGKDRCCSERPTFSGEMADLKLYQYPLAGEDVERLTLQGL